MALLKKIKEEDIQVKLLEELPVELQNVIIHKEARSTIKQIQSEIKHGL